MVKRGDRGDHFAKKGARLCEADASDVLLAKGLKFLVKEIAAWVGKLHSFINDNEMQDHESLEAAYDASPTDVVSDDAGRRSLWDCVPAPAMPQEREPPAPDGALALNHHHI